MQSVNYQRQALFILICIFIQGHEERTHRFMHLDFVSVRFLAARRILSYERHTSLCTWDPIRLEDHGTTILQDKITEDSRQQNDQVLVWVFLMLSAQSHWAKLKETEIISSNTLTVCALSGLC